MEEEPGGGWFGQGSRRGEGPHSSDAYDAYISYGTSKWDYPADVQGTGVWRAGSARALRQISEPLVCRWWLK